ncbi:hypothetical protein ACPCSD_03550 [Streptomyces griseoincarnatus]
MPSPQFPLSCPPVEDEAMSGLEVSDGSHPPLHLRRSGSTEKTGAA